MKKEFKPLSWKVKYFNCNRQVIEDYDILEHRQDFIKKLKKNCEAKEIFANVLRSELMWRFWSKSEWELIIETTDDNRILLKPWVGFYDSEKAIVDVTDDTTFDWRGFAEWHIALQRYKNRALVDAYDQLAYGNQFEQLVDYCWHTHLKWERRNSKFDQ